jgi:hypothetical protein
MSGSTWEDNKSGVASGFARHVEGGRVLAGDGKAGVRTPKGIVGKYYRQLKSQISFRIDNDVLDWLKRDTSAASMRSYANGWRANGDERNVPGRQACARRSLHKPRLSEAEHALS